MLEMSENETRRRGRVLSPARATVSPGRVVELSVLAVVVPSARVVVPPLGQMVVSLGAATV